MVRVDAERNRARLLDVALVALDEDASVSMAEIARRADVGMATLYRNFPSRRDLLEAAYADKVDAIVGAADTVPGATAGARLDAWLRELTAFIAGKHGVGQQLLATGDADVLAAGRTRVLAAGERLLRAAIRSREVRRDLALAQVVDLVLAVAAIRGEPSYVDPILQAALDGLRPRPKEARP